MSKFVEVLDENGATILINVDLITHVDRDVIGSEIHFASPDGAISMDATDDALYLTHLTLRSHTSYETMRHILL